MGRQVNFFMVDGDESLLLDRIRHCDGAVVPLRSTDQSVVPLSEPVHSSTDWPVELCVVPRLRISELARIYHPTIKQYLIAEAEAPVIQWHRSRRNEESIHRGRLWVEIDRQVHIPGYGIVRGEPKGDDLCKLFDCTARWIRKFERDPFFGFYVGSHAMQLHRQGKVFRQD